MFAIEMLPANHGDCLWIEYGEGDERHHVVIDGGPPYARDPLAARLAKTGGHVELLVISHVDFDHVGGIVSLLADPPAGIAIDDVWFNGWDHLPGPDDQLGAVQGEMVSAAIIQGALPWNRAFDGGRVANAAAGELVTHTLPGGLALTLLSPTTEALARLRPKWEREVRAEGMTPGDFEDALKKLREREGLPDDVLGDEETDPETLARTPFRADTSLANDSSIALLAEYDGRTILLSADAVPTQVERAVQRLCAERGVEQLPLDALKLSHHGSKGSTSADLLDRLACPRFLVSTNGKIFRHPAREAIARVILHGGAAPELLFNYRSPQNAVWDDATLRDRHGYATVYPGAAEGGLRVEL
jgi:hypothetical protein